MNTLYLVKGESELFASLPGDIKEGWEVQTEHLHYQDTAIKRKIRLETMNVADPTLRAIRKKAKGSDSQEEVETLIQSVNLSELNNADFQEVLYAMGPTAMSVIISAMLREASNDEMVEQVAALTSVRHLLFVD